MKHKIWFLIWVLSQTGCGVELRDKAKTDRLGRLEASLANGQKSSDEKLSELIIDSPMELTGPLTIEKDRVVLTKNATITTGEYHLMIIAREIESDGALIQNFPEGAAAFWERNGRSGGMIGIESQKARGVLNVNLNGEGGGHGKNGCITDPRVHPGCAGTSGGNGGNAGSLRMKVADNDAFNLNWSNSAGALGPAGVRGSVQYALSTLESAVFPPCDRDAVNGVAGKAGSPGQVCLKFGSENEFRCQE